jgi:hypothetical protein
VLAVDQGLRCFVFESERFTLDPLTQTFIPYDLDLGELTLQELRGIAALGELSEEQRYLT